MLPRLHRQSPFLGGGLGALEHCRGDVCQRDLPSATGEVKAGMTTSRRDIQRLVAGQHRQMLQQGLEVAGVSEYVALAVTRTLPVELLLGGSLDRIEFCHGAASIREVSAGRNVTS